MTGIYKITSPSGKVYIGQSRRLSKRRKSYELLQCKGQTKLYNSLKKYGFDSHRFEILEKVPAKFLDKRERFYYDLYLNAGTTLLNIQIPGEKGNTACSPSTKFLIAQKKHKAVKQYSKEGIFIKDWTSVQEAASTLKISRVCIGNCCRKSQKTAGGFIWMFKDCPDELPNIERSPYKKRRKSRHIEIRRPILQFSKKGEFIKEWFNSRIAAQTLGINQNAISMCSRGFTNSSGGFVWKKPITN